MSSNYWSSTTNANNTNNAWHVNFNNGNVNNNNKSNSYYVRAVRSGKCELFSFFSVYQAYLDCRKRKRGTVNALRFEYDLLENIVQLALDIQQGNYRPYPSVCFVTTRPKLREIFAADFRDRIVHHLVVRAMEKIWEPIFVHDSYASRKGKGTHAAVKRLQRFMWKATRSMKKKAWYLQLDIRSFFMSIDKNILFSLIENVLKKRMEERQCFALLYLLHRVIYHDFTIDYRFKGNPAMLLKVPDHKSLFKNKPEKGLPIGNLTSQFFSNIYLNQLDQFVKHALKCRFYVRYVDDFVLISDNREQLLLWKDKIEAFISQKLSLELKSSGTLRRVSDGVDFLGYIVRPGYLLTRRRVVNNLKAKLEIFKSKMVFKGTVNGRLYCKYLMMPDMVSSLKQTLSSYLGHFKHANTFNLLKSIWKTHKWLNQYFYLYNGVLKDRFRYGGVFRSLKAQLNFFRNRLGEETALLIRVGKYYELFGNDATAHAPPLGLRLYPSKRGTLRAAGFPAWMKNRYINKFLRLGTSVAIIEQNGPGKFVINRYVNSIFIFGGKECESL